MPNNPDSPEISLRLPRELHKKLINEYSRVIRELAVAGFSEIPSKSEFVRWLLRIALKRIEKMTYAEIVREVEGT